MNFEKLISELQLEGRHYKWNHIRIPTINADLYTPLGKRLFDLYQKYTISSEDQREIERLVFVLSAFTAHREQPKTLWERLKSLGRAK